MAIMCSPIELLRVYLGELSRAITVPDMVAMELYAKKIISKEKRDEVQLSTQTTTAKNIILLKAVEAAISTHKELEEFLTILDNHPPSDSVATEMRSKLTHSAPLEMYCETCDLLVCQYCTIKDHEGHDCNSVTDIFPKHKQKIETELELVKQQLSITDAALKVLKERADQISVQGQEVEQQIHTTTQKMIKDLQESEKQLREEVRTGVQLKLQLLSQQIETVESNQAQLKSCREFVEEEVRVGSQQQVLTVERQMVERMRAVSSQVRSSELQPVEEANVTFTVNKEVLSQSSKLGEVNTILNIASKVVTKGKGKEITMAGQKTSFELITTSSVPLPLNLLSCQLTVSNSFQPVECTITPTQPGRFTVHYTPATRVPHQLKITVGGNNIPSSPFTVHVLPSPEIRGRPLTTITGLNKPWGVAVSERGEVVVSESGGHCISVFNGEGMKIRSFGSKGFGRGQFNEPSGIALTRNSLLLVADAGNHRIQVLTLEGKFGHLWDGRKFNSYNLTTQ